MSKFLTIKEASQFLGVTPLTLRNWDKAGKLKPVRHPMSNYRLYKYDSLQTLLTEIENGTGEIKVRRKPKMRKLTIRSIKD
ncbi:MAG: MerR family DNA-binding transcriptional regulator [bacterium]|nr:MerR family DNA-binding transcriptional regulator [bacterium]